MDKQWYLIENIGVVPSPSLVLYPERVEQNIKKAVQIAGDSKRLRPHIKTHKMPQIVQMHLERGVTKFKCATIAEAEMAAEAGAKDILVATQPVGPNLKRLANLQRAYGEVQFSTICDNPESARQISSIVGSHGLTILVYVDVDCGMGRTGIPPGREAVELYRLLSTLEHAKAAGLHVYDGHIHQADARKREEESDQTWKPIESFIAELKRSGLEIPAIIAGGTPTFPFHAKHPERECSPGTYVFWDFGYQQFADLDFLVSALLITRVISKPGQTRLCLDLGHKAVASESPPPRVQFLNLPNATPVMHNEEHMVVESSEAINMKVGDVLYALPRHICPTVAMHDFAFPVENGKAGEKWQTVGRRRFISI